MNEYRLLWAPVGQCTGHRAGRQLLEQLYGQVSGEPMPEITVSPRGKPDFSGGEWHFSITHTRKTAFCAISPNPIGIDAEELTRQVNPSLAEKILSPGEYSQYLASPDRNRALLTFWVLKEASAKWTGTGLRGYPRYTNFSLADPRVTEVAGCLLAVITEEESHAAV